MENAPDDHQMLLPRTLPPSNVEHIDEFMHHTRGRGQNPVLHRTFTAPPVISHDHAQDTARHPSTEMAARPIRMRGRPPNNSNKNDDMPVQIPTNLKVAKRLPKPYNTKSLCELVFDTYFTVDLTITKGLLKDSIWAIFLHLFGEKMVKTLRGWMGRVINQRIVQQRAAEQHRTNPHASMKQLEEQAVEWLAVQEKNTIKSQMSKRVVHFVRINWSEKDRPLPMTDKLQELAQALGLSTQRLWPIVQENHKEWMLQYTRHFSKTTELDPEEGDLKGTEKRRKIESGRTNQPHANGCSEGAPFPMVQITKDEDHIYVHMYIPFLIGKLQLHVSSNRIHISGTTQHKTPEIRTETAIEFKPASTLDELVFTDGNFQKEIFLGQIVDPASLGLEVPDPYRRILHLNIKNDPYYTYEA